MAETESEALARIAAAFDLLDAHPGDCEGCDMCALQEVTLTICGLCLRGAGGQCHTPGCAMWMNRAPDIPVTQHLAYGDADGDETP